MITYAGIGSRSISNVEILTINALARQLAKRNFILYSGNADGTDIAFQTGSNSQCVLMLPWNGFNRDAYDTKASIESFDLGGSLEGLSSIAKFRGQDVHPNPSALSQGARRMMARNYHQVFGYRLYPQVSFVVYCADEKIDRNGTSQISGGTRQAVCLARIAGIPTFNIRQQGWGNSLGELLLKNANN